MFLINSLVHTERADLNQQIHRALESTFVEIEQSKKKNIVCGSIYRHPSSNVEDFIMYMVKILDKLAKEDKILLLMGDFNLNLLNYQSNTEVSNFYDSISSFMLQPLILQPTRVSEKFKLLSTTVSTTPLVAILLAKSRIIFHNFPSSKISLLLKSTYQISMVGLSVTLIIMHFWKYSTKSIGKMYLVLQLVQTY